MKKLLFTLAFCLFAGVAAVSAQPRPAEKDGQSATKVAPAPASFAAKYEGGMYGFGEKQSGTLKFDDANERIVFYSAKDGKEKFSISYASMLVIFPESKSVSSTTGDVISYIPLPGARLAGLLTEKRRYLVVNYSDPDVDVKGLVNFKLDNKELLTSVLQTLGEKAKLKQRGDAFYRPRTVKTGL